MRLLLSAFSCEPGRGSEPEVGYRALLGAARQHDVWALVSATGLPALERSLTGHPDRSRIHLVPVPVGRDESKLKLAEFHVHYARWQRRIAGLARDLDRQFDFDVVHHVTLSPMWTPVGVAAVPKPLVWGPVGGAVETPLPLLTDLGLRGASEEAARMVARRLLALTPWSRAAPRQAVVVLAQNRETAARLRTSGALSVLSNGTAVEIDTLPAVRERSSDVAFVGRLVPWKGTMLALRTLHYLRDSPTRLRFFGAGEDEPRLARTARRWGLAQRVSFEGWLPREQMLEHLAAEGVLLHPSMHDEAGLSVAEALSLGTPVVCLRHGGPAEVVSQWPERLWSAVPVGRPAETARRLAEATSAHLDDSPPVAAKPVRPRTSFVDALEKAYRQAATVRHH